MMPATLQEEFIADGMITFKSRLVSSEASVFEMSDGTRRQLHYHCDDIFWRDLMPGDDQWDEDVEMCVSESESETSSSE